MPFGSRLATCSVSLLALVLVAACGSEGPAAVNSSPTVTIATPATGATRVEGEELTFQASASDPEDGDVSGSLEWSSDVDGALGAGSSVTTTLTLGEHEVTARATDSEGATGNASVTVEVVSPPATESLAIVFTVITPAGRDIYAMEVDGTNVVQLTDSPGDDETPQWSPDGSKILFTSERDGNSEIYMMDPDGSNQTRITTTTTDERWPSWSPDGSRIAFERQGSLGLMDADGSNEVSLFTGLSAAGWPDWSPDGTRLVATAYTGESFDVYLVDLATSDTTNLTDSALDESHPTWSVDGARIAFSRKDAADDVWVMDADGTGQTKLTEVGSDNLHPDWSPDGQWIVFQSNRTGNGQIFQIEPDGSTVVEIGGTAMGDIDPSWR